MDSVLLPDVTGIPNCNVSEATGIAERWKRWLRAFELYSTGKGVTDNNQKYALLLHTADMTFRTYSLLCLTELAMINTKKR